MQQKACQDLPLQLAIVTHEHQIVHIHNCSDFDSHRVHHHGDDSQGNNILSGDIVSKPFCSLSPIQIPPSPPPPSRDKNYELSSGGTSTNAMDAIQYSLQPNEACCICGGGTYPKNHSKAWSQSQQQHRMLQLRSFFVPLISLSSAFIIILVIRAICQTRRSRRDEGEEGGEENEAGGGTDDDRFDDNEIDPHLFPEIRNSLTEEQILADRRELIMKNIIHKAVVAKDEKEKDGDDDDESVVLPHEEVMIKRELTQASFDIFENTILNDLSVERMDSNNNNISHHSGALYDLHGADYVKGEKTDLYLVAGASSMPSRDSAASLYSPSTCPICIETYKMGEEIAWSFNEKCHHAFHLECISDWLMSHDDCPMCRLDYLNINESEEA